MDELFRVKAEKVVPCPFSCPFPKVRRAEAWQTTWAGSTLAGQERAKIRWHLQDYVHKKWHIAFLGLTIPGIV